MIFRRFTTKVILTDVRFVNDSELYRSVMFYRNHNCMNIHYYIECGYEFQYEIYTVIVPALIANDSKLGFS